MEKKKNINYPFLFINRFSTGHTASIGYASNHTLSLTLKLGRVPSYALTLRVLYLGISEHCVHDPAGCASVKFSFVTVMPLFIILCFSGDVHFFLTILYCCCYNNIRFGVQSTFILIKLFSRRGTGDETVSTRPDQ